MSNGLRAAAVVLWSIVCSTTLNANDDPAEKRRGRLVELAKSLPVIDTSQDDCPDFDLKCRGHLDKGGIQMEVRYRKGKQFEIAATNTADDTPIAVWTKKRLVAFDPERLIVFATDNVDLELQLAGTTERYCAPEFQYRFGKKQTIVRIDVPSMLLSAAGKLIDEGSTERFTRMSVSDSERSRRLTVESKLASKAWKITLRDPNDVLKAATIELQVDPEANGPLVKSPTSEEISGAVTAGSVDATKLTPAQVQELADTYSRCMTLHLGLNSAKIAAGARTAGRVVDWKKLAGHRETFGRRLQPLLIERTPPTPEELARQSRVNDLASRFPVLDTRLPDCPPFLVRGRLHGESGACDVSLRHLGNNELELTVVTVDEGLPYFACIDGRGLALDPAKPEVTMTDSVKMQWTIAGIAGATAHFNFSFNTTAEFEQFANLDIRSLVVNGGQSLEDSGSTAGVIRLANTTGQGNRTEFEYRPDLLEPKCYIRLPSPDAGTTEIEITINSRAATPLATKTTRDAIEPIVPVRWIPPEATVVEAAEFLATFWKCVYSNRAHFDAQARASYAKLDRSAPDWASLRANQLRVGRQLRDLMSIPKPTPTPDDMPVGPQLAADAKEGAR